MDELAASPYELNVTSIADPTLTRIVLAIRKALNPERVYLFGSRANGIATSDSDYDLLVIYDGPLDKRQAKLKVLDQFARFDFAMDLFVLSSYEFTWMKQIATTLANEVVLTGTVVYG